MAQGPLPAAVAKNPTGSLVPMNVDANGNLLVSSADVPAAAKSMLNITAATVVKAAPGQILNVFVTVAGSAPGSVNDVLTTGAVAAGNEIAVLPNTVGSVIQNFPFLVGLVITPGTGQTISVGYV